jgi:zinc transporter, ZIP family
MEARAATEAASRIGARLPTWTLGLIPLALIAAVAALFAALGAPGLGERTGPPVEDVAVERTVLRPGEIELTVRNDGPDPVRIEQVSVSDSYVTFSPSDSELGRLESSTLTIPYPWIEGESYDVVLLTSTGATIEHQIEGAVETPETDVSFFALMGLLGVYVGIIPVAMGMLWLPFVRGVDERWVRLLLAFTVGLLAFLAIDASLEGLEIAADGPQAFGGTALVLLGGVVAFVSLAAIDAYLRERRKSAGVGGAGGAYLALLIAIGIGLHNLGEGVAIGSAYTAGALALGAFLVIGFAIHNTTEGLAIVAPLSGARAELPRLAAMGLIAGAPAVLGALIGAAAYNASIAAFLFGVGAGAIAQVVWQLVPSIRDATGRALNPTSALGVLAGLAGLYLTSLLVSV